MSFNPVTGMVSTLCTHCGTWNDWQRNYNQGGSRPAPGKRWSKAFICSNCKRELRIPENPDARHHNAAKNKKQGKLT